MEIISEISWNKVLENELAKAYFQTLTKVLNEEYKKEKNSVFPPSNLIFNAFNLTPFNKIKVVIIGQDPYHNPGQAMGLAFSVPNKVDLPPSLKNIYQEIKNDIGETSNDSGDLTRWAKQGVLLLNSTLTVQSEHPASHTELGWEKFTDEVIRIISSELNQVVFLLWGNHANKKISLINQNKHLVLTAPHPSPLSAYRGFFGSKHFSKCNEYLRKNKKTEISW